MNSEELVSLISHFDLSWHTLRRKLVYDRGAGLEATVLRGQDPLAVMKAAVACRRQIVDEMLGEVVDTLCVAAGGEFVRDKTSKARYRVDAGAISARWDVIAIGSSNPTSDYDVSFNFGGDSSRETEAVETFNQRFIARFGAPSGEFFDTNAYTAGFMTSIDGIKLSKPRVGGAFDGLRRHKAEIDELQLALSLAAVRHYCDDRWPEALRVIEQGARTFVAWFARESRQPPAQPGDVVDLHLSKRSPGEHPIDDALAARLDEMLGNMLAKVAIYLEQLETSVAPLITLAASRLVPAGIRDDQRETCARDRLYERSLRLCSERIKQRTLLSDPDAYAAATTGIVAAVGVSNVFANEAYYSEGPLYQVGPFGPQDIFTRKHILQGVLMNIGYKLLHTNHDAASLTARLIAAPPISADLVQSWYAASKYGGRILSLLRPFENMYGQYVGKDAAVYWSCWRYLEAEGLLHALEIDEAIVAEIKKGPAGETADYSAISLSMKTVLERRLPSIVHIESQLFQLAGVVIGATCVSKAIELTSRADLVEDVEPWFASTTTPPGSSFIDVFRHLSEALQLSPLGVRD
ncbi:MAG: hypothetical protein ABIS29_17880 [Vicinamibacterales bacterium]